MHRHRSLAAKGVSFTVALLTLSLSVAVPLLERESFQHEPVVESEHEPGSCPTAHDHTVCTQVGNNLARASAAPGTPATAFFGRVAAPHIVHAVGGSILPEGHPSRAPPTA